MQIKRRIFSYPVLTNSNLVSAYNDKKFNLEFENSEDKYYYHLNNLHYSCDSAFINKKIEDGDLAVYCVVECPSTIFKQTYDLSKGPINVQLLKNDLCDKVEFSLIACATKDLVLIPNEEFDEDYQDIEFKIKKGQILAFDDGCSTKIQHQENSDNLAKSIFSIIPQDDSKSQEYSVVITTKKIEIYLSPDLHKQYKKVYSMDNFAEEFFCSLLIPALCEGLFKCLEKAKSDAQDIDDICEDYYWFYSVKDGYLRIKGEELTLDKFKELSMTQLAQIVLGSPLMKALVEIESKVKEDDENE